MRIYLRIVLLLFICIFTGPVSWAQSSCPKIFNQINPGCITESTKPLITKNIIVGSALKNQVYFYKTLDGHPGKMKILGVTKTKTVCTVFLEAVTFAGSKDETFVPNSSISIASDENLWQSDRIFLDESGTSALELRRDREKKDKDPEQEDQCELTVTKGTEIRQHAMMNEERAEKKYYLLEYGIYALILIAVFVVVPGFLEEQDKFKTQEALEDAENSSKVKKQPLFIKATRPFYKRYFLPLIQGSKSKQSIKAKYRQKLSNAGLSKEMTPEEFVALKFFMIIGGPFVFLIARWIFLEEGTDPWPLSITPVMAIVGYFYPNFWLDGLTSNRKTEILRAMPFIVDMLALSVEAGLDFMAAIQRVIEKAPPSALVEEFEMLIKETKIGSTRAEGLRQMGWRINTIEVSSFCATLIAADSVGASIGPILKQLSNELRVKRSSAAEKAGAQAATKILIPMIFFILPAVLIAIFLPMGLKLLNGGV